MMRTIVRVNPAEHVLRPMRELMLSGYDWSSIGPQLPLGLPVSGGQPSQAASSSCVEPALIRGDDGDCAGGISSSRRMCAGRARRSVEP